MQTMDNIDQTKRHMASRITQGTIGLSFLMLTVTMILTLLNLGKFSAGITWEDDGGILIVFGAQGLLTSVLALLIFSRHPGHGVGRLFALIGFLFSWFTIAYTTNTLFGPDLAPLPAFIHPLILVGSGIYLLPLMLSMGMIPLFFPDGRLPSPRWRPALVILVIGIFGKALTQAMTDLQNEIPQAAAAAAQTWLGDIATFVLFLGFIASLASLIVRFIQARGEDRSQMKWLVYTAVVSIFLTLIMFLVLGETAILAGFSAFIPSYLTISIGIAILRHRLFDIDIIIRRTLQYAILTAILAAVYYGGVLLLQDVFDALVGEHNSSLITVFSTLAIAALFNPLRTRIQEFIDQRFYRAKYDAEKALADFAVAARDEVDIKVISARLLSVVAETVQPEEVNLQLKSPDTRQ